MRRQISPREIQRILRDARFYLVELDCEVRKIDEHMANQLTNAIKCIDQAIASMEFESKNEGFPIKHLQYIENSALFLKQIAKLFNLFDGE